MFKKLLTNSLFYTFGRILPQVVSFFMLPIYTMYLLPADYGITASMATMAAIFAILFSLSVEHSLFRLYHDYKDEEQKRVFFGTVFSLIMVISVVFVILLFTFNAYIEKIYHTIPFFPFYFITILSAYTGMFAIVPRMILISKEKGLIYFTIGLVQLVVALVLNIIFIIVLQQKAIGVLKAGLITNVIMLPIYLFLQLKYSRISLNFKMAGNILNYSLPLLPVALSGWILNLSDRIFIDRFYTQADVGIYSLGYQIAGVYIMVITSVRLAYIPLFYKLANAGDQISAHRKLYNYNFYYYVFSLFFGFMIIFYSKELIGLFLNKKYFYSWIICAIITFASIFTETLFTLSIHQVKKTYYHTLIVGCSALMNLFLNWLLVPLWGMYGAAIATLICSFIMFFLYFKASQKCYYIKIRWLPLSMILFLGLTLNFIFWMLPLPLLSALIYKSLLVIILTSGTIYFFKNRIKSFISEFRQI